MTLRDSVEFRKLKLYNDRNKKIRLRLWSVGPIFPRARILAVFTLQHNLQSTSSFLRVEQAPGIRKRVYWLCFRIRTIESFTLGRKARLSIWNCSERRVARRTDYRFGREFVQRSFKLMQDCLNWYTFSYMSSISFSTYLSITRKTSRDVNKPN